jgi:hypothetical protein
VQAEVSVRGTSATRMARDNAKAEVNMSMEAHMTDEAVVSEV